MLQFYLFCFYLLWIFAILGWGSVFTSLNRMTPRLSPALPKEICIITYGLLGFTVLAILASIINFFIPISFVFSLVIMLIGIVLFFLNAKIVLEKFSRADFIVLFILLIYSSVFIFLKCSDCDTASYHYQNIKWVLESKIPLGLANLHSRFGYHSSWFTLAALLEPAKSITKTPFFLINPILLFFYGSAIFFTLNRIKTNISMPSLFLLLTIYPWLTKLEYAHSSPSPDLAVMLLCLFLTYLIIYFFREEDKKNKLALLFIAGILSAFTLTIKLSGILYFFLISLIMTFIAFNSSAFYIFLIICLCLILPWLIKGLLISGCIAYPMPWGCFTKLAWSLPKGAALTEARCIKAWAMSPGFAANTVLANWNWFVPWLKVFISRELWLVGFFISGLCLSLYSLKNGAERKNLRRLIIPLIFSFLGIVFWFFSAPDPRFGYGALFSTTFILFSFGLLASGVITRIKGLVKGKQVQAQIIILCGLFCIIFGVFILGNNFSLRSKIFDLGLFLRNRQNIDVAGWNIKLMNLGISLAAAGIFILVWGAFFQITKFRFPLAIWICLYLAIINISIHQEEIINLSKMPEAYLRENQTEEGVTIYSPKFNDNRLWDAPLLSTPYFNPKLKIKFSQGGKPEMFWIDKNAK